MTHVVSILLKTSVGDYSEQSTSRFIHQALVRRHVVIKLIGTMKTRGHSAYKHIDMDHVREKAEGLPENGVPPEIIRLLPDDDLQDKIQPQKSATPVPMPRTDEEGINNFNVLKPNGVVNEKSSQDEIDVIAQANAALRHLVEKLKPTSTSTEHAQTERIEVKTGNQMIDHFVPWYFWHCICIYFHVQCWHAGYACFCSPSLTQTRS